MIRQVYTLFILLALCLYYIVLGYLLDEDKINRDNNNGWRSLGQRFLAVG